MRWANGGRLPQIKQIIDKFQIYNQILVRNRDIITSFGSPVTFWRNQSLSPIGRFPSGNVTKCYCWVSPAEGQGTNPVQKVSPDRTHILCSGTGVLDVEGKGGGYQKYGYREHIFSTPTKYTLSSKNLVINSMQKNDRYDCYNISGASLDETLTSERITLEKFKDVNYCLIRDSVNATTGNITYSYSIDDINWVTLTTATYSNATIANKYATIVLPVGTQYIRFKIRIRKVNANAPSPSFNSIRFRYRNMLSLAEIDPRFSTITYPAFLASREQISQYVESGPENGGWKTKFTNRWWVLPDATIENSDLIKFLQGTFEGQMFTVNSLLKYTYGNNTQILHRGFEAELIRDSDDVVQIAYYLL